MQANDFECKQIATTLVVMGNWFWLAHQDHAGFGWLTKPARNLGLRGPKRGHRVRINDKNTLEKVSW